MTKSTIQASKEAISDTSITTRVKAKFILDDLLKALKIHVETSKAVVTLSGDLPNKKSVDHAITIAKEIEGVKKVVSKLNVK